MIDPNNMVLPQGSKYIIKEVGKGLYSVINAYDGNYQYFQDRIVEVAAPDKKVEEPASCSEELKKA